MTLALAKKQIIKSAVLVVSTNAPLITILMKRVSNIFEGIINYNNILYADEKARKGKLKFIGYKIYNKYFKLYVITNKLISVTSKSRLLLSLMRNIISTYIIIIFHKRYNAYEILL